MVLPTVETTVLPFPKEAMELSLPILMSRLLMILTTLPRQLLA